MQKSRFSPKFKMRVLSAVMFPITVLFVWLFCRIKGQEAVDVIRNTVMSGIGSFAVFLFLLIEQEKNTLEYDNGEHCGRFFILWPACLGLAAACSYLPVAGWPFIGIFVVLALFSNTLVGMLGGTFLLVVSMMLSGGGLEIFLLYFLCGTVSAGMFHGLDESYKIGIPITVSMLMLLLGETASVVLYANDHLNWELFLIPFINLIVSFILLLIMLKVFSVMVVHKYRIRYMEINDQEHALMIALKEKSKDAYFRAVHTAYFCERIGRRLSLDTDILKAGAYYHEIGILTEENTWDQADALMKQNAFPAAIRDLLREYLDKSVPMVQKETAVLLFSNDVITTLLSLFSKDKDAQPDYDQMIEKIFRSRLESGILKDSHINISEINLMRKLFKEEKLYYDFLR